MSRVLLTGATGFLGMEVLARLLERTDRDGRGRCPAT
jgi:thioester reductase-like protein